MRAEVGKHNIVHPALGTADAVIYVAPLCEFNPWVIRLPVLLEKSLVAALVSRSEWIFLLERLATKVLVELGMILHSLTATSQNLLENLVVRAFGRGAIALAHMHLKGGQSTAVARISWTAKLAKRWTGAISGRRTRPHEARAE